MKAIVHTTYGPPEVLRLEEVEAPAPGDGEVRLQIRATTVTTVDCIFRRGDQLAARLFTGPFGPRRHVLGGLFSGEVKAVGGGVERFREGDLVFGATDGFGTHAEYICLPEAAALAEKPAGLSHEEAAALCEGALTALPFLREVGRVQRGHEVLVNGASGSVGTAAVQLARHFGAEVTGVCSSANAELVEALGAASVIDYTAEDFTRNGRSYDIIFDAVGKTSFSRCKGSLNPSGVFLSPVIGAGILMQMLWTGVAGSKKAKFAATGARPVEQRRQDLLFIKELVEAGALVPVVDRCYGLEGAAEAHRYVEEGHKRGNVVLTLDHAAEV